MEGKDIQTAPEAVVERPVATPAGARPRRSRVSGWALAAALAVVAVVLYEVRVALLPFVFATAIAFVMDPVIRALQRRIGCPRWVSAVILYLCIVAVAGGIGYWIGVSAGKSLMHVVANAPALLKHFLTEFFGKQGITVFGHHYTPGQIVKEGGALAAAMFGSSAATKIASMAASMIFGTVLLFVLMPYLMISGPRLAAGTIWLLPPERRPPVEALLPKLIPALRRYLVGIFLVVVYTAMAGWIGFGAVFHLPHAVLLSLTVGVLELVPVVGPALSAAIAGMVAIQQTNLWGALSLMGFAIALRLSIDDLVGPLLLGKAGRIHPVVVIISFVCGAMLFGVVGLLLAVPTAVVIKTALEHYYSDPVRASSD